MTQFVFKLYMCKIASRINVGLNVHPDYQILHSECSLSIMLGENCEQLCECYTCV